MTTSGEEFRFEPQPRAAAWLRQQLDKCLAASPTLIDLQQRFYNETSTRLTDFVERLGVGSEPPELRAVGFREAGPRLWVHDDGMFPVVECLGPRAVMLRVDDVIDFAAGHQCLGKVQGAPLAPTRRILVCEEGGVQVWAVERNAGRLNDDTEQTQSELVLRYGEAFRTRRRAHASDEEGFAHALEIARDATRALGAAYASELFFRAEREYWESRNDAGAFQKRRQDALGLGWGNRDHHTYRSSRQAFRSLIEVLEVLGMKCRERFYAGAEAGWGAQVMEHPDTGSMVFADVDLSQEEVLLDFAHDGLAPREHLGTVGLWCQLHGEAFLQAGLHHLEGQFDFEHASRTFERHGGTMSPFTNFPHLKQRFTVGQRWAVSSTRLEEALRNGWLTQAQADGFLLDGALGSHLEILERNDGFKGFNQKGISEIIAATDPRGAAA